MNPQSILILLVLIGGALALLLFFLPEKGIFARLKKWRLAVERQQIEDALKYIFNLQQDDQLPSVDELSGALRQNQRSTLRLVFKMQVQGLIEQRRNRLQLTPEGQRWAIQVVRAHRLWERYLADEARVPLEQIHEMAHKLEHKSSLEQIADLDAALGHPIRDPHGDPIPNAAGELRQALVDHDAPVALTDWKIGERAEIVHLEDEPPVAYAQLIADGINVGQHLTVLDHNQQRITVTDGNREITIAPAIAANVHVRALPSTEAETDGLVPLYELKTKSGGRIVKLDERCQGFSRRRFLDLGLTPGTRIFPELDNPFKEPRAYRVRGTLIALRNDQAGMIWVQPETLPEMQG